MSAGGLLASVRRLLATAGELAQVRLELLGNEIEQEKLRLFDALLIAALALVGLSVGLVLLCALIVLLFWDTQRWLVLTLLTGAFLAGGVWALTAARARLRESRNVFEASAVELARDRDALMPHD